MGGFYPPIGPFVALPPWRPIDLHFVKEVYSIKCLFGLLPMLHPLFPIAPLPIAYCLFPIPYCLLPIAPSMNATIKIQKEWSDYCQWLSKSIELWDKAIQAHQAK